MELPLPPATGRPRAGRHLLVETVGDDVLVLEPATAQVHQLNDTAAAVLDLCDGERTLEQIAVALAERYGDGSSDQVRRDVRSVVAEMHRLGLVDDGSDA